jgi:hypothetical protein
MGSFQYIQAQCPFPRPDALGYLRSILLVASFYACGGRTVLDAPGLAGSIALNGTDTTAPSVPGNCSDLESPCGSDLAWPTNVSFDADCSVEDQAEIAAAVAAAQKLAEESYGSLANLLEAEQPDSPRYQRAALGTFDRTSYQTITMNFAQIFDALTNHDIGIVCHTKLDLYFGCLDSDYAYVHPWDTSHTVYLCPMFWSAPLSCNPHVSFTRPGVLVHELSHFKDVVGTLDDTKIISSNPMTYENFALLGDPGDGTPGCYVPMSNLPLVESYRKQITVPANGIATGIVNCPAADRGVGALPIGGGWDSAGSDVLVFSSRPNAAAGWEVKAKNLGKDAATLTVYANCLFNVVGKVSQVGSTASLSANQPVASIQAVCPSGLLPVAGGFALYDEHSGTPAVAIDLYSLSASGILVQRNGKAKSYATATHYAVCLESSGTSTMSSPGNYYDPGLGMAMTMVAGSDVLVDSSFIMADFPTDSIVPRPRANWLMRFHPGYDPSPAFSYYVSYLIPTLPDGVKLSHVEGRGGQLRFP